jgi:hypothetical protein
VEHLANRVEATYAPSRWSGLEVRASWSPTSVRDGIDLEVQVSASSVGELRGLEAIVFSRVNSEGTRTAQARPVWVQPRDARSAGFSYDGRVSSAELRSLTTLPLLDSSAACLTQVAALGPGCDATSRYLEMAHPHDVARRISRGQAQPGVAAGGPLDISYGLFGHDLEKGVVIRARIRGLWVLGSDVTVVPEIALRDFLETPPPLGP